MLLSRDEATPCGDGVFKGVKVAWPGSGGQREEFPLGRVRRFDRFALRAYSRTYTRVRSFPRVPLMMRRRVASMHLPAASTSDLSATAAIYLRVWFIDSSIRGRPR